MEHLEYLFNEAYNAWKNMDLERADHALSFIKAIINKDLKRQARKHEELLKKLKGKPYVFIQETSND